MSERVKDAESLMRARDHLAASPDTTVAQRWVIYEALADAVPGLVAEIARLREALGFYADPALYRPGTGRSPDRRDEWEEQPAEIQGEGGAIARAALAGEAGEGGQS